MAAWENRYHKLFEENKAPDFKVRYLWLSGMIRSSWDF